MKFTTQEGMNIMTTTSAPYEVKASELGRANRVFKEGVHVFKLAQHLETGEWAIWMMYTETHDQARLWAETKHLSFGETMKVYDNYKLDKPIEMATKVDDDISPEYARENEGIFECRCIDILHSV